MYTRHKIRPANQKHTQSISLMGKAGLNLKDLAELMNPAFAINNENYFVMNNRGLSKRGGIVELTTVAGNKAVTLFEYWKGYYIFGYETTVAAYNPTTDTVTNIKTDWATNAAFSGAAYGSYFFVGNTGNKINRISFVATATNSYKTTGTNSLGYTGKTVDFTAGQILTGSISHATATITSDSAILPATSGDLVVTALTGTFQIGDTITDALGGSATLSTMNSLAIKDTITGATSGATGTLLEITGAGGATQTLTIDATDGTFQNGEILTNGGNGRVFTTSALTFAITEISGAPMSGVIRAIGPRLYAGVGTDVYYPSVDDGSNPPFQTWTVATTATAGGKASFRNAGTVKSICSLGDIIVVFGDMGKWAFRITTQNDGTGVIVKLEEVVIDRIDMGGASGAITCAKGLFYVNKAGLWQLISLGQPNIPFSDQEVLTSVLLGTDYFDDTNLDNADLIYYDRFNTVLVTCAKQSTQNNHVIAYNPDVKAFSTFRNWNINRWMSYQSEIYGASSVKTTLYHCFTGNSDDGIDISVDYLQELQTGDLWTRQMLYGAYIKGLLHKESNVSVAFDIYNVRGEPEKNKLEFEWTAQYSEIVTDGWGIAEWGRSPYGGDVDLSGMIECFAGMHQFIRNFQRIRVHITEGSKLFHQLDWLSLDARPKASIRRRDLNLISTPL